MFIERTKLRTQIREFIGGRDNTVLRWIYRAIIESRRDDGSIGADCREKRLKKTAIPSFDLPDASQRYMNDKVVTCFNSKETQVASEIFSGMDFSVGHRRGVQLYAHFFLCLIY
jgi:hypothetical protein